MLAPFDGRHGRGFSFGIVSVPSSSSAPGTEAERSVPNARGRIDPPLPPDAPLVQRALRTGKRLGHGLVVHDAFASAPAMAFHFFLSLMPLLVFIGYVVGVLVKRRGAESVLAVFLENLPDASREVVRSELERLGSADALGPIALVGFLWLAAGGIHGLMDALETVVGAPRRPWWKKRALGVAWTIGAVLSIVLASFLMIEWDAVVHPERDVAVVVPSAAPPPSAAPIEATPSPVPHASSSTRRTLLTKRRAWHILRKGGQRALVLGISLALAIAALAAFYRFSVSHPSRVKRRVLPGAVLAVSLWIVISWGFGLYARTLATYAVYYGSLTAVAVTLIWLWLTSLAILVGAELNAQLEGLRD